MTEKKPSERQLDLTIQRADQNRQHLRGLLLTGASSPPTQTAEFVSNLACFTALARMN